MAGRTPSTAVWRAPSSASWTRFPARWTASPWPIGWPASIRAGGCVAVRLGRVVVPALPGSSCSSRCSLAGLGGLAADARGRVAGASAAPGRGPQGRLPAVTAGGDRRRPPRRPRRQIACRPASSRRRRAADLGRAGHHAVGVGADLLDASGCRPTPRPPLPLSTPHGPVILQGREPDLAVGPSGRGRPPRSWGLPGGPVRPLGDDLVLADVAGSWRGSTGPARTGSGPDRSEGLGRRSPLQRGWLPAPAGSSPSGPRAWRARPTGPVRPGVRRAVCVSSVVARATSGSRRSVAPVTGPASARAVAGSRPTLWTGRRADPLDVHRWRASGLRAPLRPGGDHPQRRIARRPPGRDRLGTARKRGARGPSSRRGRGLGIGRRARLAPPAGATRGTARMPSRIGASASGPSSRATAAG